MTLDFEITGVEGSAGASWGLYALNVVYKGPPIPLCIRCIWACHYACTLARRRLQIP